MESKGILTDLQKKALLFFSSLADSENFFLTGGTALSEFFLGHRKSFDLDLFTGERQLILPFSRSLEEEGRREFELKVIRRFETFVEFELSDSSDSVILQLAFDSPFHIDQPEKSDYGVRVNSYRDLITDKLLAFFGRTEPRDAVDLYFILEKENLENLIEYASEKDPGFDLYWLAVSLEKVLHFPDDPNQWPVEMVKNLDTAGLKKKFNALSQDILKKLNKGESSQS